MAANQNYPGNIWWGFWCGCFFSILIVIVMLIAFLFAIQPPQDDLKLSGPAPDEQTEPGISP